MRSRLNGIRRTEFLILLKDHRKLRICTLSILNVYASQVAWLLVLEKVAHLLLTSHLGIDNKIRHQALFLQVTGTLEQNLEELQ